jgi:hypothetical protein
MYLTNGDQKDKNDAAIAEKVRTIRFIKYRTNFFCSQQSILSADATPTMILP